MDRYDPNEWTKSFVTENQSFCLAQLRDTNDQVVEFVKQGNYAPAIAGLDRILNGLITMVNAGGDYRSQICFFSWIEADIILFGIDAPEDRKRETALRLLEDARDFAKSDSVKQNLSAMISDLKGGTSLSVMKADYGAEFPASDIDLLKNLNGKLHSDTMSSSASSNYNTSSGCGSGCFTKLFILAVVIAAIYFGMSYFTKSKEDIAPTPAPTPVENTTGTQTQ